jgi:hypothetical protein
MTDEQRPKVLTEDEPIPDVTPKVAAVQSKVVAVQSKVGEVSERTDDNKEKIDKNAARIDENKVRIDAISRALDDATGIAAAKLKVAAAEAAQTIRLAAKAATSKVDRSANVAASGVKAVAADAADHVKAAAPLPATTTAQEDVLASSTRRITFIFELTQAILAVAVTAGVIFNAARGVDAPVLTNAFFLIIGLYFQRSLAQAAVVQGRAAGGSVSKGQSYTVGEKGPERFTPSEHGSITSNDDSKKK